MCDECGCDQPKKIIVQKSITEVNDSIAHQIWHNLKDKNILCVNILGSPGSGKTTLIEGLSRFIEPTEIAVIQGDLESSIDKDRLNKLNIDCYQINTHSGCHLNASMVNKALLDINLTNKKYLFIENVGNLVCPAGVKIGQHLNIVVSSVTEGSDKPKKYPLIFQDSKLAIISKSDLIEYVDFNEQQYIKDIQELNSTIKIIKTSYKQEQGFKQIISYLEHQREHLLNQSHKH